jgi:hypothetical protein
MGEKIIFKRRPKATVELYGGTVVVMFRRSAMVDFPKFFGSSAILCGDASLWFTLIDWSPRSVTAS